MGVRPGDKAFGRGLDHVSDVPARSKSPEAHRIQEFGFTVSTLSFAHPVIIPRPRPVMFVFMDRQPAHLLARCGRQNARSGLPGEPRARSRPLSVQPGAFVEVLERLPPRDAFIAELGCVLWRAVCAQN